jgi:hypothetical protein
MNITGLADDQLEYDYNGSNVSLQNVITLILNTPLLPLLHIIFCGHSCDVRVALTLC